MRETLVCGIDPGKRGAIALIATGPSYPGNIRVALTPMPLKRRGGVDGKGVRELIERYRFDAIYIEEVGGFTGDSAGSAFTFGRNFGVVEGVCDALMKPCSLVKPRIWQCAVHILEDHGINAKERSLSAVRRLYPFVNLIADRGRVPHDGFIDALLIAHYALGVLNGNILDEDNLPTQP